MDEPFELRMQRRGQSDHLLQLSDQFVPLAVKSQPEKTDSCEVKKNKKNTHKEAQNLRDASH